MLHGKGCQSGKRNLKGRCFARKQASPAPNLLRPQSEDPGAQPCSVPLMFPAILGNLGQIPRATCWAGPGSHIGVQCPAFSGADRRNQMTFGAEQGKRLSLMHALHPVSVASFLLSPACLPLAFPAEFYKPPCSLQKSKLSGLQDSSTLVYPLLLLCIGPF